MTRGFPVQTQGTSMRYKFCTSSQMLSMLHISQYVYHVLSSRVQTPTLVPFSRIQTVGGDEKFVQHSGQKTLKKLPHWKSMCSLDNNDLNHYINRMWTGEIELVQGMDQWQAFVNMAVNLWVHWRQGLQLAQYNHQLFMNNVTWSLMGMGGFFSKR